MTDVAELQPRGAMPKKQFEPLAAEIFALKKQLNAVILAHNYQVLKSRRCRFRGRLRSAFRNRRPKTNADVIVFCGVHFMAETAKILNLNKIVVLAGQGRHCLAEESCPADKLAALQKQTRMDHRLHHSVVRT